MGAMLSDGRNISIDIMTEDCPSKAVHQDLSSYPVLDIRDSIVRAGGDSLRGYTGLVEFSCDRIPLFLLLGKNSEGELWTAGDATVSLDAGKYVMLLGGERFTPSSITLFRKDGRAAVMFRRTPLSNEEIVDRSDVVIIRYEEKDIDLTGSLIALDGTPLPGTHTLRYEERNGEVKWFLDGAISPKPEIITGKDMSVLDFSNEYIIREGKLIPDPDEAVCFAAGDTPWLMLKRRGETSFIKEEDVITLEKEAFHTIDHERLIITRDDVDVTSDVEELSMAEDSGHIWFRLILRTGETAVGASDCIRVSGEEDAEDIPIRDTIVSQDGKLIQNTEKLIAVRKWDREFHKLFVKNGIVSVHAPGELTLTHCTSYEGIPSKGIRLESSGKSIWDIRKIWKAETEEGNLLLIKASTGIITIHKEKDVTITRSAVKDSDAENRVSYLNELSRITGSRRKSLGFIPEGSVLGTILGGSKAEMEKVDLPLIFPFGVDSHEMETVSKALDDDLTVLSGEERKKTVLNVLSNLILRGGTAEIVSSDDGYLELLKEKGLYPAIAELGSLCREALFRERTSGPVILPSAWKRNDREELISRIHAMKESLEKVLSEEDHLRRIKEEKASIEAEIAELSDIELGASTRSHFLFDSEKLSCIREVTENHIEGGKLPKSFIREKIGSGYGDKEFWKQDTAAILKSLSRLKTERELKEKTEEETKTSIFLQQNRASGIKEELENTSLLLLKDSLSRTVGERERKPVTKEDFINFPSSIQAAWPIVITPRPEALMDRSYGAVLIDGSDDIGALAESGRAIVIEGNGEELSQDILHEAEALRLGKGLGDEWKITDSLLSSIIRLRAAE